MHFSWSVHPRGFWHGPGPPGLHTTLISLASSPCSKINSPGESLRNQFDIQMDKHLTYSYIIYQVYKKNWIQSYSIIFNQTLRTRSNNILPSNWAQSRHFDHVWPMLIHCVTCPVTKPQYSRVRAWTSFELAAGKCRCIFGMVFHLRCKQRWTCPCQMCLPTTWDMESFVTSFPAKVHCNVPWGSPVAWYPWWQGNHGKSKQVQSVHLCPPMSTYLHLSRHRARFPGALQHFYAFACMCMHFYAVIPILSEWDLDGFSGTMSDS